MISIKTPIKSQNDTTMELLPIQLKETEQTQPTIIAGPCSAETEEQVMQTARELAEQGISIFRAGIWKPRTKPGGFEGIGTPGLQWLKRVKRETGMKVATEVANRDHVFAAIKAGIDLLWIGARTTVNPFAVQEIADALEGTDMPVLVKNPVNPDLELWIGALERLHRAGLRRLGAIHRGFSSHDKSVYRNVPLWNLPKELRNRIPNLPIFSDPSHIGGRRDLIAPLSRQALDFGFDGLLIESHCDPDVALSDKAQQLTPQELGSLVQRLYAEQAGQNDELVDYRCKIDEIDEQLWTLLGQRMQVSREIGVYKQKHAISPVQPMRFHEMIERRLQQGEALELSPNFVRTILHDIHEESIQQQCKRD